MKFNVGDKIYWRDRPDHILQITGIVKRPGHSLEYELVKGGSRYGWLKVDHPQIPEWHKLLNGVEWMLELV